MTGAAVDPSSEAADPGESVDTGESEDNGESEGTGDEPGKDESESSTHNCDYNEPSNAESDEAGGSSYGTKKEADEAFRAHTDPLNLKGSWPSWHEWEMYQEKNRITCGMYQEAKAKALYGWRMIHHPDAVPKTAMLKQVQEEGATRSEDVVEALDWMLPQAHSPDESIIVLLDRGNYGINYNLTEDIAEKVRSKGHVLRFWKGGASSSTQIDDTHVTLHAC